MSCGYVFQPVRFIDGPAIRNGNGTVYGYLAGPGRLLSADTIQMPGTRLYLLDGYARHVTEDENETTNATGQC
jgi:hypothetical protein